MKINKSPDQPTAPIAEIIGPSGRVHYRRSSDDPMIEEARATPGYSVRFVWVETVEARKEIIDAQS